MFEIQFEKKRQDDRLCMGHFSIWETANSLLLALFVAFVRMPCNGLLVVGCGNPSCNHVHGPVIKSIDYS